MVPFWILMVIGLAGGAFAFKMVYVLSVALALPVTRGALFVSTTTARIHALMDALPMKPGQLLVDLGCGDGRVLRLARERYQVTAVGYEINLMAYLKARLKCIGRRGIRIKLQNFWHADLSGADVIFCYLFPDVLKELSIKLKAGLKPGAVVACCNFPIPGFVPTRVFRPDGELDNDPIYIYRV
jgi:SAM-dependent methyltransferase